MLQHTPRWTDLNNPYRYRNDNLRQLGFESYRAYLDSPLWKNIRVRVLERAQQTCERCRKNPARQVHHRAYDPTTLRGDSIDALTATCGGCHRHAERTKGHAYDRLQTANQTFLRARRARQQPTDSPRRKPKRDRRDWQRIYRLSRALEWTPRDGQRLTEWTNRPV
jgi:hypothetical protein